MQIYTGINWESKLFIPFKRQSNVSKGKWLQQITKTKDANLIFDLFQPFNYWYILFSLKNIRKREGQICKRARVQFSLEGCNVLNS